VLLAPEQDRVATDDGTFCRPCFDGLTAQLHDVLAAQGREVSYGLAAMGGLAGAALGVLAWWGFTALTKVAFGLVAIVIGIAVAKGVNLGAGPKRHRNLQILAVAIAVAAFAYASYLVNRTFLHEYFAEQGVETVLPWLPDPALFSRVLRASFDVFDLVFLGIVVWEAWRLTAPAKLAAPGLRS
jgi:hypothetical protein